ncbi:hypothetical protein ABPG72_020128 [Tetrahymena utriculariae]
MQSQELDIVNIKNKEILEQTIVKFKKFLVEELKIQDDKLNTNEGLQEKLGMINQFESYIQMIGKDYVSNYIVSVIVNHFNLNEITKEQKQKLQNFMEVFMEIALNNKNNFDFRKNKRALEKQKEREQIETLEKNGGINCDETRDEYLCIKFMNFYISQKIQYLDYYKKNNKKTKEGKVIFSKKSFNDLHDQLEKEVQEKNETTQEKNNYIKKHFDSLKQLCNVFKELTISENTFYLQKYKNIKNLCNFKIIQKDLDLTFY